MFGEKVSVLQSRSKAPMLRNVKIEVGSIYHMYIYCLWWGIL